MPKKKKKKESWKEKRRRAALKRERVLEAERVRREREPKKKQKGWPRGKVFGALFLISLCLVSYGVWQYTQPSSQPPLPEGPSLYTLTNTDFSEFRGKAVILDFFATWCTPCIQQIPHLAEIHEKYDSSDVVILSIGSSTDTADDLEQFKEEHDMSWKVARDTVGTFDKYSVQYIPKLVILDQEGSVNYEHEGVTSTSDMANVIDSLLSP
jgi:thiol-disulfide isomerase/thioredoxin